MEADGKGKLSVMLQPGAYDLTATTAEGFGSKTKRVSVEKNSNLSIEMHLAVGVCLPSVEVETKGLVPVCVTVVDPIEAGISRARVNVVPSGGGSKQSMEADGKGELSVMLQPGDYDLTATAQGFNVSKTKRVSVEKDSNLSIEMRLAVGVCSGVEVKGVPEGPHLLPW